MKMMRKTRVIATKQKNHIKSELNILSSLSHPFSIVNLIASFQDRSYLYLVLELVSDGEFFTEAQALSNTSISNPLNKIEITPDTSVLLSMIQNKNQNVSNINMKTLLDKAYNN